MATTPAGPSPYRLTRRAFLTTAGASAAAAILAACGGGSTATDTPKAAATTVAPTVSGAAAAPPTIAAPASTAPASSVVAAPGTTGSTAAAGVVSPTVAVAAQAKPGGKLVIRWYTGDPPDMDPYLNVTFRAAEFGGFFYSRLLKFDNGPGIAPTAFTPVPDLAEKFVVSPDGLTYTFTIRANAKWQNKDPMNGRAVTADDVVYSFDRFRKVSPQKQSFDIVKDVKATDPHTVVFTLTAPFAPFDVALAAPVFYIMPKEVIEADGDARKRVIGSGPWIFDKYDKGVQIVVKKNPDYYFAGTPNVDEVDLLIVPEDATAVANLRAKQIDINGVSETDRKGLQASNPELQFLDFPDNLLWFFFWKTDAPPFNDIRVRQAVSLALDRDEMINTLFEGRGALNNSVPAGLTSWWLDPRSADMGANAKYYKRDVDAAKKLMADAGFAGGLKVPFISTQNAYGNTFNNSIELVIKQMKDIGLTLDFRPQDYAAYIGSTFLGKYEPGTMVWALETQFNDPHYYLFNMYHPTGTRNHASVNDPTLTAMIEKETGTLDRAARKALIFDIQRYLGEKQYYVVGPSGRVNIATQPWVKNFFYQSDYGRGAEYVPKVFLDGKK